MTPKGKIFFIGIGGIGMSGLAEHFLRNGFEVSGSDVSESHITERLRRLGAVVHREHSASNIVTGIETVVYTSAVGKDNPEMAEARKLGIRAVRRAEMLGEIVNDKFLIAVSGTHGKTTTTAMVGKLLEDAGLDPLVFVGGNVGFFEGSATRFGSGMYAVVEADEYDRSFLALKPDIAVITSIDEDHLDVYSDIEDIKKTFRQFCMNSKKGSRIVYFGDDGNISDCISPVTAEKLSYGFGEGNYLRVEGLSAVNGGMRFTINNSHNSYPGISLGLIGRHNVLNSAACFAVSKILGIGFESYKRSIGEFRTVDRRLQLIYDSGRVKVYDDYAHHPREIECSLSGLREAYPERKVVVIFQPHLYSRTRDFYKEFARKLSAADKVILLDIYPARELPIEGVTSSLIFDELKKMNTSVYYAKDAEEMLGNLLKEHQPGDLIVFQGAGDVTELCSNFVMKLKEKQA